MAKDVKWTGPPDARCVALVEHGYEQTVEPDFVYTVPDELAVSLVTSSADWQPVGWTLETAATVKEIIAGIGDSTDDELAVHAQDTRKTVRTAAEKELARRAELTGEEA